MTQESGPSLPSLCDPGRVRALAESGLTRTSDPDMEYFAQRVRTLLGVPVALVSLVQPDQQVFPGMVGLPEPWASRRSTPLSHSFCRHVVAAAQPLVVGDARVDPLVRDNLAVSDLGVVAYAGMPLTDADGRVLGSLCAIDVEPRAWTDADLDVLRDLARACSTELRLRLSGYLAEQERARRDELEDSLRAAVDRSQLLLTASQALNRTLSSADVRDRVAELLAGEFKPAYVDVAFASESEEAALAAWAAREPVLLDDPDPADLQVELPAAVLRLRHELDLRSVVCAPLPNGDRVLGVLVLGWDRLRPLAPLERAVITAIAGYTGQALGRARVLEHRMTVAHDLQAAMLSPLPRVDGLELAASYLPADAREYVGGDWYDATPVPDPLRPDGRVLAVTVGDIAGHTTQAATIMGQVRAMLRQAGWDHAGAPPSRALSSLEAACRGVGVDARGSAVLAHLHPLGDDTGRWSMRWSNAGHPPPILLCPDGSTLVLDGHDMLFGYPALLPGPRRDHELVIDERSTLLLYTDGLVERRGIEVDEGIRQVCDLLADLREASPQDIVDTVVQARTGGAPHDDVVALAVRICRP